MYNIKKVIVFPDAQNHLVWENIAADHRQERVLMIENTISTVPTSSSVPPNYSFSFSSPHSSMAATHAPICPSLAPSLALIQVPPQN